LLHIVDEYTIAEMAAMYTVFRHANGDEGAARCLHQDAFVRCQIPDRETSASIDWHLSKSGDVVFASTE
jgi:hypothetical protein